MRIWKIVMGCLSIVLGAFVMYEAQEVMSIARIFGVNSFSIYAGFIVSLLYIGIGIVVFAMANKKNSNSIIGALSIIAFIFSFCGPQIFADLPFLSVWAVACGLTAFVCFLKDRKSNAIQNDVVQVLDTSVTPRLTKKCPYCDSMLDSNSVFCDKCGKNLDTIKHCPHCGTVVNNDNAFCQNCGNKVDGGDGQQVPPVTTPEQKHCPCCGAVVSNDGLFCENCGRSMADGGSAPTPNFHPQAPYEPRSNSQNKFVLPIVIGMVVLALAGGGWWYYKSSKNSTNNETLQEVVNDGGNVENPEVYSKKDIQAMKEFLEEFYSKMGPVGYTIEDSHIKKNVTANALKTLKKYGNEYLSYDESSGGQLADCKIEHIKANLFEVCIITYMGMGIYPEYKVRLSVVKENGSYKIDTIEKIEPDVSDDNTSGYESILSTRKLIESDLSSKNKKELEIMRNSIYARYGYKFKRNDLLNHFSQFSWYNPTTSDMSTVYNSMSDIEKYNIDFIKKHE